MSEATRRARATLERGANSRIAPAALAAELAALPDAALGPVIEALLEEDRKDTLLRAEERWLSRLGWRLARPLLACAILAAPLFLLQDLVPPAQGLALFLAGAASFFVLLQLYVQRWTGRVERARARRDEERSERLARLAAELGG